MKQLVSDTPIEESPPPDYGIGSAHKVITLPTGWKFSWLGSNGEEALNIFIEKIIEDRHHIVSGELEVDLCLRIRPADPPALSGIRFNLTSTQARAGIVKRLREITDAFDWSTIVEGVVSSTLILFRQEEPSVEIWPSEEDDLVPSYLLEPILYLNHPAVIFGDYGSLKSLKALAIAYVVQLPFYDNDLGLIPLKEPTRCLYLDYEDDSSSFRKRWSALERGFGKGDMPILYRRMTASIADSIEGLKKIITEKKIGLIIVDSLGPAARGNLNDAEPAIQYHAALRQLNVTSLTLAHTSKDLLTKRRTIFGSVFFTNLARSVWECKSEQETGEDEAIISLKHTKANLSKLHTPLGFHFTFTNNAITIVKSDLRETGLSGELPLAWQIKNLLRSGSLTKSEIAETLDKGEDVIRITLKRMEKRGDVVMLLDKSWGLKLI